MEFPLGQFMMLLFWIWCILAGGCYIWYRVFLPRRTDVVQDPAECRLLIASKDFKKKNNLLTAYESRAKHNEWFRLVFGIDNSFTTVDAAHSNVFSDYTRGLMLLQPNQWEKLSGTMSGHVRKWLDAPAPSSSYRLFVPLATMVQSLTLRFLFLTLNQATPIDPPDDALVRLADAINCTWVAAKRGCEVPAFKDNDYLLEALSAVFPNIDLQAASERDNPLNWILPGFDTIWRVVLRLVIELGYHDNPNHLAWTKTLIQFAHKPTRTQLMAPGSRAVSAEHIVNEALRLYPPKRRIYRSFQHAAQGEITTYAADVEGCHLATGIWGKSAPFYDPLRWKDATVKQEAAFIPFGAAPFLCPARHSFGPRAIGLLAGLILYELRFEWSLNQGSDNIKFPYLESRLSNEGNAYLDLFFVKNAE